MKMPFIFLFVLIVLIIIAHNNPPTREVKEKVERFETAKVTIMGDFVGLDTPFPGIGFAVRTEGGVLYQIEGERLQEIIDIDDLNRISKIRVTGVLSGRKAMIPDERFFPSLTVDVTSFKVLDYVHKEINKPFIAREVTVQGILFRHHHPFCCYAIRFKNEGFESTEEYLLKGEQKLKEISSLDSLESLYDGIYELKVTGLLTQETSRIPEAGGFARWTKKVIDIYSFEIINNKERD